MSRAGLFLKIRSLDRISIQVLFFNLAILASNFFLLFYHFESKEVAITLVTLSAITYGVFFGFLESVYVILDYSFWADFFRQANLIFILIRFTHVLILTLLLSITKPGNVFLTFDVVLIFIGLSSISGFLALLRSCHPQPIFSFCLVGFFSFAILTIPFLSQIDAVGYLRRFASCCGILPLICLISNISIRRIMPLLQHYISLTKNFFLTAPATALLQNIDKLLLIYSPLSPQLVVYSQLKSIFTPAREFSKILKNSTLREMVHLASANYSNYLKLLRKCDSINIGLYLISSMFCLAYVIVFQVHSQFFYSLLIVSFFICIDSLLRDRLSLRSALLLIHSSRIILLSDIYVLLLASLASTCIFYISALANPTVLFVLISMIAACGSFLKYLYLSSYLSSINKNLVR
jgi:hypothetical protein